MLKRVLVIFTAACLTVVPFNFLQAETETILAYEEAPLVFENDEEFNKLAGDLLQKAFEKGHEHPCVIKARSEGKQIKALIEFGSTTTGKAFVKITTTDC